MTPKAKRRPNSLPVETSNPDKIFWPDEGYTKLDLAEFYASVFTELSPYVKDHLLTLERCPDGMHGGCFYQKEKPKGMPTGTPSKRIRNETGKREFTNYIVGGSLETQLALVNLGCIAVHVMAGRASSPRKPGWVCFDLDPQSGKFADAARAALAVKKGLDDLKLRSFVKTSGSRGAHVFVPIRTGPDADDVLSFAEAFAARVAAENPKELTVEHSIAARGNKVYVDPFVGSARLLSPLIPFVAAPKRPFPRLSTGTNSLPTSIPRISTLEALQTA